MPAEPKHSTDLLSSREVAEALGVQRNTVHIWRSRGEMPEAIIVSGHPLWKRHDIAVWAARTGRLTPESSLWPEARRIPAAG